MRNTCGKLRRMIGVQLSPIHPRYLDLSNNALTGTIPPTFLGAKTILNETITIRLTGNNIEGGIPREFTRFRFLNLELGGNKINEIPPELCRMRDWYVLARGFFRT